MDDISGSKNAFVVSGLLIWLIPAGPFTLCETYNISLWKGDKFITCRCNSYSMVQLAILNLYFDNRCSVNLALVDSDTWVWNKNFLDLPIVLLFMLFLQNMTELGAGQIRAAVCLTTEHKTFLWKLRRAQCQQLLDCSLLGLVHHHYCYGIASPQMQNSS